MNDVTAAIAECKSESITQEQMMRRLLVYRAWTVPRICKGDPEYGSPPLSISKVIPMPDAKGLRVLPIFSIFEAFKKFWDATESPGDVGGKQVSGHEFFTSDLEGVDAVVMNPGTSDEWTIKSDDFDVVQLLADAVEVEEAWIRLAKGNEKEGDNKLAAWFGDYQFAVVERDGVRGYCTVPNDNGDEYIPVFTHVDAFEFGLPELRAKYSAEELQRSRAAGEIVFPSLAQQTAFGIVINFAGPTEPVSFRLSVTEMMLAELAKGNE
jgi:hypothetical protein